MLGEREENKGDLEFKWGPKRGISCHCDATYESFTFEGVQYDLYDCVYFYRTGDPETSIGKLLKIYETPTHEKKVKVVWFFRPSEIRSFLVDVELCWNELFLASGEGVGLSNINPLESIIGKCDVICTSRDERNPVASEEELRNADYIFSRNFDVKTYTISEVFEDKICGVKVEHFFNKKRCQSLGRPLNVNGHPEGTLKQNSHLDLGLERIANVKESEDDVPSDKDQVHSSSKSTLKFRCYSDKNGEDNGEKRKQTCGNDLLPLGASVRHFKKRQLSLYSNNDLNVKVKSIRSNDDVRRKSADTISGTERVASLQGNSQPQEATRRSVAVNCHHLDAKGYRTRDKEQVKGNTVSSMAADPSPPGLIGSGKSVLKFKDDSNLNGESKGKGMVGEKREKLKITSETARERCLKVENLPPKVTRGPDALKLPTLVSKGIMSKEKVRAKDDDLKERMSVKAEMMPARAEGTKHESAIQNVKRRPDAVKKSWFNEPWDGKLQRAEEVGNLVSLENLDPSYTSLEVEDIVWTALGEQVEAKMVQRSTFSSPHYGKAFVIFKTKVAAESALSELSRKCLMLSDGRCVVAGKGTIAEVDKKVNFPGHLSIDKPRHQQQRREVRDAVSTSHFCQPNNIEFDLAVEWQVLQEQSNLWWKALHERQEREIQSTKKELKRYFK